MDTVAMDLVEAFKEHNRLMKEMLEKLDDHIQSQDEATLVLEKAIESFSSFIGVNDCEG